MADQPKTEKKTAEKAIKEKKEKKVKADGAKPAEPVAAEAVSTQVVPVREPKKSMKIGKLPPKNKHRLPRRLKKAQKKAAAHL
jgi:hypothetical protein